VAPTKSSGFEQLVFGKDVVRSEFISKPYGVAIRDGRIYVCDMRAKALTVLDLRKKQTRLVGVAGPNQLSHPVAVAVADDGTIYVADNIRDAVLVFDRSERFLRLISADKFRPVALAISGDRLYACDMRGQVVRVFDRASGKQVDTIGSVGDEDGQFRLPIGIAADRHGDIYVTDLMRLNSETPRMAVQKFGPDGKFICAFGPLGDYAGSFARPKHIAVDNDGIVYIVDAAFQNVQMFDDQNRLLMHFGAPGDFPGAMNLPVGVAVCDDGLDVFADQLHPGFKPTRAIVVSNQFGEAKVSVYVLGQRREGTALSDLTSTAAAVHPGVETPDAERLRLQNPGGIEPAAPDPGAEVTSPEKPPTETSTPPPSPPK
jgi:DNA-binding beta-propeller fold protein YncE